MYIKELVSSSNLQLNIAPEMSTSRYTDKISGKTKVAPSDVIRPPINGFLAVKSAIENVKTAPKIEGTALGSDSRPV
eukprot:CAMPEP_0113721662 /NCGR_PEP_ID=MMETSP0038_2-20120614/37272_1 /TAXON_ID=2898 /ORGANISM="Cryptomonas paramecium" /LENGTH=76 /DNA_ID=CAMNT_0000650725 /DNA_START=782 /DNA_END=1009 /DNA_ORIENTATION=- /assembly_acc=CAM_ASM_000170